MLRLGTRRKIKQGGTAIQTRPCCEKQERVFLWRERRWLRPHRLTLSTIITEKASLVYRIGIFYDF